MTCLLISPNVMLMYLSVHLKFLSPREETGRAECHFAKDEIKSQQDSMHKGDSRNG